MLTGSCLCQRVKFQVRDAITRFVRCHCTTCRKAHGTVYGSSAIVASKDFQVVTGHDTVKAFESSPGKKRWFCSNCGSHVYARRDDAAHLVILRVGTLDSTDGRCPEAHIWVSHKADWYSILDGLPQHECGWAGA